MAHWLEHDGRVHADAPGGMDYTLCGAALEGETGDQPMTETSKRVDCADCVAIIEHCKGIRAGAYVTTQRQRHA
jgi:hypothetical protein